MSEEDVVVDGQEDSDIVGEILISITKEGWKSEVTLPPQDAIFWLEATKARILKDVLADAV